MTFTLQDWELLKPHVSEFVQVEAEAMFSASLAVHALTMDMLIRHRIITPAEVERQLSNLDVAAAEAAPRSAAVANAMSLASMQLRDALSIGSTKPS